MISNVALCYTIQNRAIEIEEIQPSLFSIKRAWIKGSVSSSFILYVYVSVCENEIQINLMFSKTTNYMVLYFA